MKGYVYVPARDWGPQVSARILEFDTIFAAVGYSIEMSHCTLITQQERRALKAGGVNEYAANTQGYSFATAGLLKRRATLAATANNILLAKGL